MATQVATTSPPLRRRWAWRRHRLAYALVAPAAVFMTGVHLVPLAQGLYMACLDLDLVTFREFLRAPFVGVDNFRSVLFDADNPIRPGLGTAARNTAIFAVVTTALTLATGLGAALLLNRRFRGRRFARVCLLTPWVVPTFVVGSLWSFMWQSDTGMVNIVLVDWLGIVDSRPVWLSGHNAMVAIVVPSVWHAFPFSMLVFLAALQTIPHELHEAAAVDGAGAWRRFRHVTLPLLRPTIAVQLLFTGVFAVYTYTIVAVMFSVDAGYPGEWADLLMTSITRQTFGANLYGYGAAASTLLMAAMLVVVALWYRAFRRDLEAA